jgi:hypothetical protein
MGRPTPSGLGGYGLLMTEWPEGWRPRTREEAQEYLDAHPPSTGDDEVATACATLLDQETGPLGAEEQGGSAFPKPSEDQLEERGAD